MFMMWLYMFISIIFLKSAGMIGAVTIGVVAVGNFVIGASMGVLSDYMANVDKNKNFSDLFTKI